MGENKKKKRKKATTHLGERHGVLGRGGVAHAGGTLEDVLLELISAVVDALGSLRAGQRAVDAARGFGGVPSQEWAFVQ